MLIVLNLWLSFSSLRCIIITHFSFPNERVQEWKYDGWSFFLHSKGNHWMQPSIWQTVYFYAIHILHTFLCTNLIPMRYKHKSACWIHERSLTIISCAPKCQRIGICEWILHDPAQQNPHRDNFYMGFIEFRLIFMNTWLDVCYTIVIANPPF